MQFYSQLTLFAKDVMAIFDKLVWELARRHMGTEDPPVFRVQVHNLLDRSHRSMRDINDSDVDTLITIKGIVIRCSELIPDMQYAFKVFGSIAIVHLCVICDSVFSLHFLSFFFTMLSCCDRHAYFHCNTDGCDGQVVRELKEGVFAFVND